MLLSSRVRSTAQIPWWLIFPTLLLLLAVSIGPFLYGVAISFLNFRLVEASKTVTFVGFSNYIYEIFHDKVFSIALANSFKWVAVVIGGSSTLGLFMAVRLNREFKFRGIVRVVAWLPWATPLVAVATIWQIIYQPHFGLINGVLTFLGLKGQYWLAEPSMVLYAVAFAQIWRWTPFFTIMLLAGMQAIPNELYEAAKVDGAMPWQTFYYITLPLLRSIAGLALLIGTIWAFKTFTLVYVLTGGGPANSSQVLSTWGYQLAFRFGYLDRGAVLGVIAALILLAPGTAWLRSEVRKFKHES